MMDPSGSHSRRLNRVSSLQQHKQTNSFGLLLGVFICHSGECLSRGGKQTDRARPVGRWNHAGGRGLLHGRSGGEHYRCEPGDKMESFRNRIMASRLNAPQFVCQVTAALHREMFISESGGGRTLKQEQQRVSVVFTGIMIQLRPL